MTDTQPEALRDARWYMVNKMGMATLCKNKKDAGKEARDMDMAWPHMGPHRAVQLVEAADVEAMRAAQPAGAQQPDTAYAELPSYEHQRAIMEAERNASLDEYSRIVPLTSTESMIYERAFTNGWNRHAAHGQAPAPAQAAHQQEAPAMHSGWVSCTIEFDGSGPEEVAYGPKIMMDRLAKWLGKHFERTIAEKAAPQPLPASQGDALDAARLDWLTFNLSGKALRDIGVVWSEHGDARRAIDAARAAQEGK